MAYAKLIKIKKPVKLSRVKRMKWCIQSNQNLIFFNWGFFWILHSLLEQVVKPNLQSYDEFINLLLAETLLNSHQSWFIYFVPHSVTYSNPFLCITCKMLAVEWSAVLRNTHNIKAYSGLSLSFEVAGYTRKIGACSCNQDSLLSFSHFHFELLVTFTAVMPAIK